MASVSYKRILVPLDGSKRAERIFPHVEELAKQHAAKLILLYVIEPSVLAMSPGISMMVAPPPQELESYWKSIQEAEQAGEKYLKRRSAALAKKGFSVETLIQRGDPVSTIVNTAQERKADLIAMTSHGRSGLARVFYGSVTSGVLQKVDRPLLLIRAEK